MYLANRPSLIRRQSCKPSRFGMIQSVITKLIGWLWRISHACAPSDAGTTSYPHFWRVRNRSLRISTSSSTISIRIVRSYHSTAPLRHQYPMRRDTPRDMNTPPSVIASDQRERGNLTVVVLKDCEIASASPRNDTTYCISILIQQLMRDYQPLNLGRPLVDLGDAGVAEQPLGREVVEIPIAAVNLQRR